jgi:hypothetical protein
VYDLVANITDSPDDEVEPAVRDTAEEVVEVAEVVDSVTLVVDVTVVTPTVAIVADASADAVELVVVGTIDGVVVAVFGGVVIVRTDEGTVVLDKVVDDE